MVSDLSLPFVHLAEIVHLRSGKLELDEERWAWCLKPAHLRSHADSSVFFENFRIAVVDGDEYQFSALQAAVLACLHAHGVASASRTRSWWRSTPRRRTRWSCSGTTLASSKASTALLTMTTTASTG
jgi:hypothetical protein